ncbi:MAG: hypothetical protein J7L53_10225 [Deltaproteobacteria bacterium]|nr:hypothetical protein [Deltaproteobacteria bacterium]
MYPKTYLVKIENLCKGDSTVYIHTEDLWWRGVCSAINGLRSEGFERFIVQCPVCARLSCWDGDRQVYCTDRKDNLFLLGDHQDTLEPIQNVDIKNLLEENDNLGFIDDTRPYQVEAYADIAKDVASALGHAPDIHIFTLINQAIYIGIARGYGDLLSEGKLEKIPLMVGTYVQGDTIDITPEVSRIRDSIGGILEFVTRGEIQIASSSLEVDITGDLSGITWLLQERDRIRKKKKTNYLTGDIIISNHTCDAYRKIFTLS